MQPLVQEPKVAGGMPRYRPQQTDKTSPCEASCASGSDVRTWIGFVAQRDQTGIDKEEAYSQAWRTITDANPFPSVLGRICPHPCEFGCNRSEDNGAVAISALERFLGDWAIEKGLQLLSTAGRSFWMKFVRWTLNCRRNCCDSFKPARSSGSAG